MRNRSTSSAGLALSLMLAATPGGAEERTLGAAKGTGAVGASSTASPRSVAHVTSETTLGEVVDHPAFSGVGRLLLPWDDRPVDRGMRLHDVGRLLPYHTHVEPGVVASALNRMIDVAAAGHRIAYDIYSPAEKDADPSKRNTALFLLRGRPGAPFAVISPGGGFAYVGSVHEGFPYAAEIATRGYNAFVLKYRAGQGGAVATQDLAVALSFVMRNARDLGVATSGYSLWGSSAGARMAASIGSHGAATYGGDDLPKPAAVVMAYTAHSDWSRTEPPTFVVVGQRDSIAPPSAVKARVAALRAAGNDVEFHEYPGLPHGFGLGTGTVAEGWAGGAMRFWERQLKQ